MKGNDKMEILSSKTSIRVHEISSTRLDVVHLWAVWSIPGLLSAMAVELSLMVPHSPSPSLTGLISDLEFPAMMLMYSETPNYGPDNSGPFKIRTNQVLEIGGKC